MKRYFGLGGIIVGMIASVSANAQINWQPTNEPAAKSSAERIATNYTYYKANAAALRGVLTAKGRGQQSVVSLPMPDGTMNAFTITETSVLPAELAAKYPEIKTYTAVSVSNPKVTAKLDLTSYGFHGMVYAGEQTSFIDEQTNDGSTGTYQLHYKRDEVAENTTGQACASLHDVPVELPTTAQRLDNGYSLRTYRLALSCNNYYAKAVTGKDNPTKAEVLSKMTTTLNRVNGIYERELSVTMQFTAHEDTLIFIDAATDPFDGINESAVSLLEMNQTMCDSLIGDANYDVGHIFSTGGGGLSQVGVVCKSGFKAQSVTGGATPYGDGYDVDYVSHEIGHEFGADHTFNNNAIGGCTGNGVASRAFEPGSGSTIMAYAGLCAPDNLQEHSDAYFHAASLDQIHFYINLTTGGDACGVKAPTANKLPGFPSFSGSYTIPANTPFELTAPIAADSTGNASISYCWEQWNLGDFGKTLSETSLYGPLFRSYSPTTNNVRMLPSLSLLRSGLLSNAGINNGEGEKIPTASRFLTFRLTARSILNGVGSFIFPDDSIHINVIGNTAGFMVTSQNTNGIVYAGYNNVAVSWNTAGTNSTPINTPQVDIFLSADGGATWPISLGTFANTGGATVVMPNPDTTMNTVRLKVKGHDNLFFSMNSRDFKLIRNVESSIQLYPSPVHGTLHLVTDNAGELDIEVVDAAGRKVMSARVSGSADIATDNWARGIYFMRVVDAAKQRVIRKFAVE